MQLASAARIVTPSGPMYFDGWRTQIVLIGAVSVAGYTNVQVGCSLSPPDLIGVGSIVVSAIPVEAINP